MLARICKKKNVIPKKCQQSCIINTQYTIQYIIDLYYITKHITTPYACI